MVFTYLDISERPVVDGTVDSTLIEEGAIDSGERGCISCTAANYAGPATKRGILTNIILLTLMVYSSIYASFTIFIHFSNLC